MRILVADDEPEMTMVLEALLKREHYSTDVVCNGQDAWTTRLRRIMTALFWIL